MAIWTQGGDHSSYGWFEDRVCNCKMYRYPSIKDYDWGKELLICKTPPWCGACGLWANRVMMCAHCDNQFYQFFNHPCMGYHPDKWKGWFCWNCLERFWPPVVWPQAATRKKVPPPAIVLPPGYELYIDD